MKKFVLFATFLTAFSFALIACGKRPKSPADTTGDESTTTEISGENSSSTSGNGQTIATNDVTANSDSSSSTK
ncbi:MAG: hypothetical protein LBM05_01620 [Endomicrobium sp.]|jgi:hypothetical protein|nr:hypothetical protein [Endomicrobium sp.]